MNTTDSIVWNGTPKIWGVLFVAALLLVAISYDGLADMVHRWGTSEEYGYGYLIPFIALFFIFQKKNELVELENTGAWSGFVITALGLIILFLGELSTLYVLVQYAFLLTLFGLVLAFSGWRLFGRLLVPLLILVFMIPLPGFLYNNLSSHLQLISSELGVAVIRLFDISVHLEGNVIDLGTYKLQVVEACSGLRYLFPLVSLSFIAAYIYHAPLWKRVVVFLSSVPITILMNSFRIGMIGVLVEYYGPSMAEGFLHDFEGWFVFMACMGVLFVEILLLTRLTGDKRPFAEIFSIEWPEPMASDRSPRNRMLPAAFIAAVAALVVGLVLSSLVTHREEVIPSRSDFSGFPLMSGDWVGKRDVIEQIYIDKLKLDDYFIADYRNSTGDSVNFYVAYYGSQRKGESAHSPRSCIPGGGWQIKNSDLQQVKLDETGTSMRVNRLLIQNGDYRQLVFYWFDQRGRTITNEFTVKWYLFWDALTKNRTDGALVRITTLLQPGEALADADRRLQSFAAELAPRLPDYVPD